MSDAELLASLDRLVREERRSTVKILRHLAEADQRGACLDKAYPSLFAYCIKHLGYSEGAAARRIYSARRARDFPIIYRMLACGEITLAAVYLLSPHLTPENHSALLQEASGKSKREVETIVARLNPRTIERDAIRMLGCSLGASRVSTLGGIPLPLSTAGADAEPAGPGNAPEKPPSTTSEAPSLLPAQRVRFSFTADEDMLRSVERAREILRHKFPAGRLPDIFTTALHDLLERRDPDRRLARHEARLGRLANREIMPRL